MNKRRLGLGLVVLVVGVMAGFGVVMAGEPVVDAVKPVAAVDAKVSWVMLEGRVLKNDVEVSKPSMKTISGRAVDVSMEGWDKDGVRSFILMDLTPVVVGADGIEMKGEVSVVLGEGGKAKVLRKVDERVKSGEVVKVSVELNEDAYLFEFKVSVVE